MKFQFSYKGRKIELDARVCDNPLSQAIGLMFKKNSRPLLFTFNRDVNLSIHSFFCKPFICIWFLGENIVDIQNVKPWRISVKPKKRFDKFLEIPKNHKNFEKIKRILRIKS
ncbi:MAG: DUF192 domain-containing protein [Nanoarchaeota archaeon]|nr:DUF192 domain-containing protein [Nanoarchaeota archaeon]